MTDCDDEYDDEFDAEPEPEYVYHVETAAYCGMLIPHGEFSEHSEALERVNKRIEWLTGSMGCTVDQLEDDEWEVIEPDDSVMVPDHCGILRIVARPARRTGRF